jgi:hypothetical protein
MPGPAPKDPAVRARRHRAATRADLTPAKPLETVPPLPAPPEGDQWHPLAVEWWTDLWASPQARLYTAMHKHRAYLALHTLQLFYSNPTERLGQRVEVALQGLGASESDLRKLQWSTSVEQPPATPATPAKKPRGKAQTDPRRRLRILA